VRLHQHQGVSAARGRASALDLPRV
jgi:hypothetical protein